MLACLRVEGGESEDWVFDGALKASETALEERSWQWEMLSCLLIHVLCFGTTIWGLGRWLSHHLPLAGFRAYVAKIYESEVAAIDETLRRWGAYVAKIYESQVVASNGMLGWWGTYVARIYESEVVANNKMLRRWGAGDEDAGSEAERECWFKEMGWRMQMPSWFSWETWDHIWQWRCNAEEGIDVEKAGPLHHGEKSACDQCEGHEWYEDEEWVFP